VLATVDRAALTTMVESWAEFHDLTKRKRELDRNSAKHQFTADQARIRQAINAAWSRWAKMAQAFGLTPADRARVQVEPPEDTDSTDQDYFGPRLAADA
jgi:phage terminase small subunit